MKLFHFTIIALVASSAPAISQAQVAGSTLLGVTYGELRDVTWGWSAKRQILGHPVYNNIDERVGSVESTTSSSRPTNRSPTPSSMPAVSLRWPSTTSPFQCLNYS